MICRGQFKITVNTKNHEGYQLKIFVEDLCPRKTPFLALLAHRSTLTVSTGVSPAELAMGRQLIGTLPMLSSNLNPSLQDRAAVSTADAKKKAANKH